MTCDQAELRMAELLAGEIPPAEREALERHLLDCAACRGDFEIARAGARVEWADVPVPKALIESTLAAFREPPAAVRFLRWATAAAAVVGVAVLLVTSSSAPKPVAPSAPEPRPERREVLATMQDAVVGAMVCKDEDGRPVGELGLKSHDVTVEILDGIAKTTVEENFENHTERRLEGTFTFPLPSDASISRLALEVNGKIEEGTCLERERAREVFESIVRRMQDPALLEWQPGGFFKCRVFPIDARATKRVIVAYTQALPCFRGKMTYVYPLASEKTRTHPPEEVRISLQARFSGSLSKIESPSHRLDVQRKSAGEASMSFRAANYRPNNDFVVTMEPADEELRVVSHRPAGEDGYFACFLTPRGAAERAPGRYAFVLDASASISAPRLEVAKRLVRAMMERRIPGDRFEILAHNVDVERSGEVELRAANDFMDRLRPIGGSDVLKALQAAPGDAQIVYIGKGSPSFGEIDPGKILEALKGRRIRTIAVGSDANGLLLEKLGGMMRVSPNDDVTKRVEEIAATIGSPLLSEVNVEGEGIAEVVGARDLFYGERLVVSGRYRDGASKLLITGRGGYRREVEVAFPAKEEGNNYVRRLWAQRKVADLLARGESAKAEVTALGVQYQIMTPYTSFLVLESEQMWKDHQLKRDVQKQDQVLGKKSDEGKKRMAEAEASSHEIVTKREVLRNMAHLLQMTYLAVDQKRYDRAMKLCDELLLIDPHYPVAKQLRDGAEKMRHTDDPFNVFAEKVKALKRQTEDDESPAIPESNTVRFPSTEEWAETSKKLAEPVIRTAGTASRKPDPQGQVLADPTLLPAAEKAVQDLERQASVDARADFRAKVTQAGIEITKHVRDGERYLNARMYEEARKEFENAEFKIENIPYDVKPMKELLAPVKDSIVMARNAQILEQRRTDEEKKRMAETEAHPVVAKEPLPIPKPAPPPPPAVEPTRPVTKKVELSVPSSDEPRSGKSTDIPDTAEDPKARAIREAYEEQLRRDRQEVTINTKNATVKEVVDQYRRQTGWNIVVDYARIPEDYRVDELNISRANPSAALDAFVDRNGLLMNYDRPVWTLHRPTALDGSTSLKTPSTAESDFLANDSDWTRASGLWANDAGVNVINRGYTGNQIKNAPIAGQEVEFENQRVFMSILADRINTLDTENSAKAARIDDLQRQLALANSARNGDDLQSSTHQLDVPLAQVRELTTKVDEHRAKLAKALNEKSLTTAELQYARQMAERLQQDLAQLEERHVGMAREKKRLEEKINAIAQAGGNVHTAPKKALEGKVTAVANETSLVVISIGKDDGALEGDEFTIYRGGDFVAKIVIDRADRTWAAGKIAIKKTDPRVGDDVSNHIFVSAPPRDGTGVAAKAVESSDILAVTRDSKFVALVRARRGPGKEVEVQVLDGLAVGRILPDDQMTPVLDVRSYLQSLPAEVRMDLTSRSNQQVIRAKMGMKE